MSWFGFIGQLLCLVEVDHPMADNGAICTMICSVNVWDISGQVAIIRSSLDPRSISVGINNIRQISYDHNNKLRQCVADYSVEAPLTQEMAGWLRTFGASPDELVRLFVIGWRNNGIKFGICNGELYYNVQATLDGNNERVEWRCVSN